MRLFVAVYPPPDAVAHLDAALAAHRDGWPELRWSPLSQWHVTLAFLGEVPDHRVNRLGERLGRAAARGGPLALALAGVGAFPSVHRARVCWVGVTGDVAELRALATRVAAAARHTGIDVDGGRYRPHLTLGRPRRPPLDVTALAERLTDYTGPGWTAAEVLLVRSYLGREVRHEPIGRWPLGTP